MNKISVLVIGAGAAGLCAAKHLSSNGNFSFQVFEQTSSIGGTWAYTNEVYKDKYGRPVHTSMYKNLRTNIPVEVMAFLDFPFHPTKESFIHQSEVMKYLKNYADHNNLHKYIKFHKEVTNVSPVSIRNEKKWDILVNDLDSNNKEKFIVDAVMVCNGHYSEPRLPNLPGLQNFNGLVIHSHNYREPEIFAGKRVVIWGGSLSGFDIGQEISSVAKSVMLCHRLKKNIPQGFPENVKLSANIVSAFENGFKLEDGTIYEADALIICTGYLYSFPFLNEDCKIEINDNHVMPLYKHLVNIEYPTMCLVGLLNFTIPFVLFDYQVKFFLKTLDKSIKLPSKEEMKQEMDLENEKRRIKNIPERYTHSLDKLQWSYFKDLANKAKLEETTPVMRNILEDAIESMGKNISVFKDYKYEILSPENFQKSIIKKTY